jgi:drug/metabolite transporter (DMT)-like permease
MAVPSAGDRSPIARFRALPPVLRGGLWMVLGTFAFAAMIILVRKTSQTFSAFEIAFWRAAFGLVFMAPWLARVGLAGFRTQRAGSHAIRNVFHLIGIVTWYYAVSRINLSEGIALQFTVPLFTIGLAVLLLGERVDARRWIATLVGFAGVLVILRPGFAVIDVVALVTLLSAAFYAVSNVYTKFIVRTDSPDVVVFYMNLMQLPLALALAVAAGWTTPGWADLPWLAAVAASATLAHYLLTLAFREADASVMIPIDFLKLPWVAALAFIFFDEVPAVWGWLGGLIVFGSTYYIVRREARIVRSSAAART